MTWIEDKAKARAHLTKINSEAKLARSKMKSWDRASTKLALDVIVSTSSQALLDLGVTTPTVPTPTPIPTSPGTAWNGLTRIWAVARIPWK